MSLKNDSRSSRTRSAQASEPEPPVQNANEEAMLVSIKGMMEGMQAEIIANIQSTISDTIKKEIASAIKPLEEKVREHGGVIRDLELAANEHEDKLTSLQATVNMLTSKVDSLGKKCEDLEARSRWNNIRLVGLPENEEGPRPTEFLAKLLQDMLDLGAAPMLDRVHRTLRPRPKPGEAPRPIVAKVNLFQDRNTILRRAGEKSPLMYKGQRVHIFPDFTPSVAKQRAGFITVKRVLAQCANVKFGLRYPATLHVTTPNGQAQKFNDPRLAMDFAQELLKPSSETFTE